MIVVHVAALAAGSAHMLYVSGEKKRGRRRKGEGGRGAMPFFKKFSLSCLEFL